MNNTAVLPLPRVHVDTGLRPSSSGLSGLLRPGPVDPGFYLLSGGRQALPIVMDKLVGFLDLEEKRLASYRSPLSSLTPAPRSSEIGKIMWIDSGNVFDPYHIARMAARRGLDPWRTLRAIQVARPFTAFQLQAMLDKVPQPSMLNVQAPRTGTVQVWRTPLVIVSDLMSLFYDPEIQDGDVRRAFQGFQARISMLKKRAIVIGLQMNTLAPPARESLLPRLWTLATRTLSVRPEALPALSAKSA